jgi:PAS domain S-box-containing protein
VKDADAATRVVIRDFAGEGEVSLVPFSLGLQHEIGVLAVGSRRADFPTEVEQLLLRVAANQGAIGLQDARHLTAVNEDLRRSQAYLAEAQRLSHTGSFGWHPSTGIITWSEETFRIFQYDLATTPTVERVLQRVHPEDAPRVRQTVELAAQNAADFDHEYRLLMPDGSGKHVHVVAHATSDEAGVIEFAGAVQDVTAARTAEAAQLRLGAIVASSDDAIVGKTLEGIITSWNAGAQRIFGYTEDEAVGRPIDILIPPDRQGEESLILDKLKRGESVDHFETIRVMKDGREIHVSLAVSPIRNAAGQVVGGSKIARDITQRRRAEHALRQAQSDLAHVARVTTLGEMAASIAHEVDQPLSGVVINANACLRFLAGESPNLAEVRDGLQAIARDGRRASEVTARIRALARRSQAEKQLLDVDALVREVIALAEGEVRRKRAKVSTHLAGDLPRVLGDAVQLQQVVLNLLLNGLDAMSDVDDRPRELMIRTEKEGADHVHVTVRDAGAGVDPEHARRMFDAFYSTKPEGLGMGLSISRTIVEHHGGRLWAVPNDGHGTTFHFTV